MSAGGTGYSRIAKLLNAEGAAAPRPKSGRPVGWSPSTVKVILDRRLYLGEVIWNRREKRDAWGRLAPHFRPEVQWIRTSAPELRIVSDELWHAAHTRVISVRRELLGLSDAVAPAVKRRPRDSESRYLLTGFGRCSLCGGGMAVVGGSYTSARPHSYGCLSYHKRGTAICRNGLKLRVELVDQAVLRAIGDDVLRPAVVSAVLDGVFDALRPKVQSDAVETLRIELADVDQQIERLTEAIAQGGQLGSLLEALKTRYARQNEIRRAVETSESVARRHINRPAVEAHVCDRLARWRTLLTTHVSDARQLLREALVSPIRFTPVDRAYEFAGDLFLGGLLVGTVCLPTTVVPVPGL